MSAKAIREATGKELLNKFLQGPVSSCRFAVVNEGTNFEDLANKNPWIKQEVIDFFAIIKTFYYLKLLLYFFIIEIIIMHILLLILLKNFIAEIGCEAGSID